MPPMRIAVAGKLQSHQETSERRSALRSRRAAIADDPAPRIMDPFDNALARQAAAHAERARRAAG